MKTILMVAEKPSLAASLAKILSNGQMGTRKGFNSACSIHEYSTKFPPTGESVRVKFTSVCGHVMSLDFLGKYNNWDKVDPVRYLVVNPLFLVAGGVNPRCSNFEKYVCETRIHLVEGPPPASG